MFAGAAMPNYQQQENGRVVDLGATASERSFAMITHLSLIAAHFTGLLVVIPLIMWLIKRHESTFIDDHGKEVVNFQISLVIYALIVTAVTILTCGVGAIAFIAIYVLAVVGMIMGAVAANRGEIYRYPATMRFIT